MKPRRYNWTCRYCHVTVRTDSQEALRELLRPHRSCGGDMATEYVRVLRRKHRELPSQW